jgi:DinB superfamily
MATTVPQTPYSADLGSREPLSTMRETTERIRAIASGWSPAQFDRSYAPGKWSARQILVHLVQTEIALGNRARMALAIPNYTAQAFEQDAWMANESSVTGAVALGALVAMNTMNREFFQALTPAQRTTPFSHPEYGALTVDWLIHQMAGHLRHHVEQLEQIGKEG